MSCLIQLSKNFDEFYHFCLLQIGIEQNIDQLILNFDSLMDEPTNEKSQQQLDYESKINQIKTQQGAQQSARLQGNYAEESLINQQVGELKMKPIVDDKNAKLEIPESKKEIQAKQQGRDVEKNGQANGLTQKQLKKMKKIMMQFPVLKDQYEKLLKSYQQLKIEKEQLKNLLETSYNSNFELTKTIQAFKIQIQNKSEQNSQVKQQVQRRKKEIDNVQKRLQQSKKRIQEAEGMEQKVKQLSMIIDMTTKDLQQHKKIQEKQKTDLQKYKQLLKCEKELFNNAKVQLDKLRQSQKETFTMKQQLVRLSTQYKNLKAEKEQLPIMIDKFQHQEQMISQLKESIQQYEKKVQQAKTINEKFQKKINQLHDEKKDLQKKYSKVRCELQQTIGQNDALKAELQEQRAEFEVQKRRYLGQIKTLKVELHNEHQKLKITEWQLSESKKKEKPSVKLERVNVMKLSRDDLLNILEEMEMKNQSLKINLDHVAQVIHEKDKKIKDQQASIMALARELTKSYPNYHQSQGMEYVEKDIIQIGKSRKSDWGQIVEKVMIENLRLKYSVTALGEQYNQQIRTSKEK